MAFKAEELTSKIFPDISPESGDGLWAGGCPQDTMDKGGKCPNNTKKPDPPGPGCSGGSAPGPRPKPTRAGELDRGALVLLQDQLRDRMAQGSAAGL